MRIASQVFGGLVLFCLSISFVCDAKGNKWVEDIKKILEEEGISLRWLIEVEICERGMLPLEDECMTKERLLQRLSKAVLDMPSNVQVKLLRIIADVALDLANNANEKDLSEVVETVLEAINDVLGFYLGDLLDSQEQNQTSSEILDVLDALSEKISEYAKDGKPTKIEKSNIGISAKRVDSIERDIWVFSEELNSKVSVSIQNTSSNAGNNLAIIKLPKKALRKKDSIVSFTYRNGALFLRSEGTDGSSRKNKIKSKVNSVVSSASVGNRTIKNLKQPIVLKFLKKNTTGNADASCVFWKRAKREDAKRIGKWLTDGCSIVNESTSSVYCQCDHLTNFAILFDVSQTAYNPLELQIITWIGCGISLAGLIITIITFSVFQKLRKLLPAKILIFLCVHLTLLLILFLAGVERTNPRLGCQVISSLLQYLLLSSFCWMLIEAGNLYRNVIIVYISGAQKKFLKYSILFAQGIPAVIVIATGLGSPDELGNESFCVVYGMAFYFGVLLPIGIILLLNTICIILVMARLTCHKDDLNRSSKSEVSNLASQARILFTCSMTMGLTWIFAIFALDSATTVFQWLFAIFNSLQGFFIFLFRTLRNDDVIRHWKVYFGMNDSKHVKSSQAPMKYNVTQTGHVENSPAVTPNLLRSPLDMDKENGTKETIN